MIDEWGDGEKSYVRKTGATKCIISHLRVRYVTSRRMLNTTRDSLELRTTRGPEWQNNPSPTHFEINSRHM